MAAAFGHYTRCLRCLVCRPRRTRRSSCVQTFRRHRGVPRSCARPMMVWCVQGGERMGRVSRILVAAVCLTWLGSGGLGVLIDVGHAQPSEAAPSIDLFAQTASADAAVADAALDQLAESWRDGYVGLLRDLMRLMTAPTRTTRSVDTDLGQDPAGDPGLDQQPPSDDALPAASDDPSTEIWRRLGRFVEDRTGIRLRDDQDMPNLDAWLWAQPYDPHPDYVRFKALLYGQIDPRFGDFFLPETQATIRLDEVDWGGVPVNGIPPLAYPRTAGADDDRAAYLDDDDIVFGIAVDGQTRAYPKRILAWHEMALDTVGDVALTVVYCTLCGTVIPYESMVNGERLIFGTSGLLYRSNKLMFDIETNSLWNTFEGVPVVGPRVGSGIRLVPRPVVTTTWGEWRRTHPDTTVLTMETGQERDYAEGAAYRGYFATDRLMFGVPRLDDRLKNKDEVLVLSVADAAGNRQPVALSADFLDDQRIHHFDHAGQSLVVVTSEEGANRVYAAADLRFERPRDADRIVDADGGVWSVREDALVSEVDPTRRLDRQPAHRAFWFAWYAQFPDTELIR